MNSNRSLLLFISTFLNATTRKTSKCLATSAVLSSETSSVTTMNCLKMMPRRIKTIKLTEIKLLTNLKLTKKAFGKHPDPAKRRQFHECLKAINDLKKRGKFNARAKNKTAHITFLDLEDAFGSVPHSLINCYFFKT
jgi:hypothetical protein